MPTSPLRIGYFIETGVPGGAEEILFNLACEAKSAGYEPVIFHFEHDWIERQCANRNLRSVKLSILKNFKSTPRLPVFAFQFSRVLRGENIALLHSHLFGPIVAGGLAAFLARIPHLATLHDIHMVQEKPIRIKLLKLIELLATRFVAVSKNMQYFYTHEYSLSEKSFSTIYNYCDLNKCDSKHEDLSKIRIFVVGRLVKLKRVDRVINVFIDLAEKYCEIELTIIGEGEMKQVLKKIVPEKLADRVLFLGRRENVATLLHSADIFVQFSETEGLSMSVLEAIATGLPAIVSDVGGNSELVIDGENGFLVDPGSDTQLAEKISLLIEDRGLRERMGISSAKHAEAQFSKKQFVDQYFSLYTSLL